MATPLTAEQLNTQWDAFTATLDKYYEQLPKQVQNASNKAISDWQDFYFGNTGEWPAAGVQKWTQALGTALAALQAAIPKGAQPDAPAAALPSKPVKATPVSPVFYVTGKVDTTGSSIGDLPLPKWWKLAAVGVPAVIGLAYLNTRSRKRR